MNKPLNQSAIKEEIEILARVEEILAAREEGRGANKLRKERNHALVQSGIALKALMESGLVTESQVESVLPPNKLELVKKWIFPRLNQP
jgi:hypothetical protein